MRILVVEDNPMHAEIFQEYLSDEGYAVDRSHRRGSRKPGREYTL